MAIAPHEIVRGFIESTPMLTFGEHAQLLDYLVDEDGGFVEAREADEELDEAEAWARDAGLESWELP